MRSRTHTTLAEPPAKLRALLAYVDVTVVSDVRELVRALLPERPLVSASARASRCVSIAVLIPPRLPGFAASIFDSLAAPETMKTCSMPSRDSTISAVLGRHRPDRAFENGGMEHFDPAPQGAALHR